LRFISRPNIGRPKHFGSGFSLIGASRNSSGSTVLEFENGFFVESGCLQCPETPCSQYETGSFANVVDYPATSQTTTQVCPYDAIDDTLADVPTISSDLCVGCMLCVSRCPANAIAVGNIDTHVLIHESGAKHIAGSGADQLVEHKTTVDAVQTQTSILNKLKGLSDLSSSVSEIAKKIKEINVSVQASNVPAQTAGILVRNSLRELGYEASLGRPGDTNSRLDIVYSKQAVIGISQIELGLDHLDAARRLLSESATAISRHNKNISQLCPTLFCLNLPNQRSDYYELVIDAIRVLGISIRTIPIGSLVARVGLPTNRGTDIHNYFDVLNDSAGFIENLLPGTGLRASSLPGVLVPGK